MKSITMKQVEYIQLLLKIYNKNRYPLPPLDIGDITRYLFRTSTNNIYKLNIEEASIVIENLKVRNELYKIAAAKVKSQVNKPHNNYSVTEICEYIYCPAKWLNNQTNQIKEESFLKEIGILLHDKNLLTEVLNRIGPQTHLNIDKLPSNNSAIKKDINRQHKDLRFLDEFTSSKIVYYGHNEDSAVLFSKAYPIYGQPDYVVYDPNGKVMVIEEKYKTELPGTPYRDEVFQVKLYIELVKENYADIVQSIEDLSGILIYYKIESYIKYLFFKKETVISEKYPIKIDNDFYTYLEKIISGMESKEIKDKTKNNKCNLCNFSHLCWPGEKKQ